MKGRGGHHHPSGSSNSGGRVKGSMTSTAGNASGQEATVDDDEDDGREVNDPNFDLTDKRNHKVSTDLLISTGNYNVSRVQTYKCCNYYVWRLWRLTCNID